MTPDQYVAHLLLSSGRATQLLLEERHGIAARYRRPADGVPVS